MSRTRASAVISALVVAAIAVIAWARFRRGPAPTAPLPAAVTERFAQAGVAVELTLTPVTLRDAHAPFYAGQDVAVRFKLSDSTTGAPLSGNTPGAWIAPRRGTDEGMGDKACMAHIKTLLDTRFPLQAMVSLNDYYMLVLNTDAAISVVDPRYGFGNTKLLTSVVLKSAGVDWALTDDRARLFVAMPDVDRVAVVDTRTFQVTAEIEAGPRPSRVAVQPDQGYVWVASGPGVSEPAVTVIGTADGKIARRIPVGAGAHDIAFSDDSRTAFVSNGKAGTVSVIDVRDLTRVRDLDVGPEPGRIGWSSSARAVYVPSVAAGTITAIDGEKRAITARVQSERGVAGIAFDRKGRLGFAWNTAKNTVDVVDVAENKVVQTGDVDPGPDQITFTSSLAYVHHRGSPNVGMIPLDKVGQRGTPLPLAAFPAGEKPLGEAATAPSIVQAGSESAVLVANPGDLTLYYYKEGMAAPMGGERSYGHTPRSILVLDRSLSERSPGSYETTARLPAQGTLLVAFVLDSPRVVRCFPISVGPSPDQPPPPPGLAVELAGDPSLEVAKPSHLRLRLSDPATKKLRTGIDDLTVQVYLAPGRWHDRQPGRAEGEGIYTIDFTPPETGAYYVSVESRSLGIRLKTSPQLVLTVVGGGAKP